MRYTKLHLKTTKETPADEEAASAQLLVRAGFIKKEMAGVYSFLPLGLRILRKITQIVREEMDAADAVELLMPVLCPKDNWEATGRWEGFDVLFRVALSGDKEAALCPSQEEVVTPLVKHYYGSYKDFPLCLYHFQTKFRNEPRAKSGLLRCREFLMKDGYSFHTSQEDFEAYYEQMKQAYFQVYSRLGIGDITHLVAASGGAFSKYSHEFQTLSEVGEDTIYIDSITGEAWNREIATGIPDAKNTEEAEKPQDQVKAQRGVTVEANADHYGVPTWRILKTLLFKTELGGYIAAMIRGDLEVNEDLLSDLVGQSLTPATEECLKKWNLPRGFIGPVELPAEITLYADSSTKTVKNFITSNNCLHQDIVNFNVERDAPGASFGDFAVPTADFLSPNGNAYTVERAVEVGNIFPLGTRFSDAFDLKYLNEDGKSMPVIMGCYGIGVSRLMGILAEIFRDAQGLRWPKAVAPFQVYIAPIGKTDAPYQKAEELETLCNKMGVEVLLDDRRDRRISPGQKFADQELLGIPVRVVVSERSLERGIVEWVDRLSGQMQEVALEDIQTQLQTLKA